MPLRPLAPVADVAGRIWLSSMPGRFEPWNSFLTQARQAGLTTIVCLTPLHEIGPVSPPYQTALDNKQLPFEWIHLPMRDLGLALAADQFAEGITQLAQRARAGEVLLLHCAAGIGRTGTAAACLLKSLGLPPEQALQRVRDAGSNPESALQWGLISRF